MRASAVGFRRGESCATQKVASVVVSILIVVDVPLSNPASCPGNCPPASRDGPSQNKVAPPREGERTWLVGPARVEGGLGSTQSRPDVHYPMVLADAPSDRGCRSPSSSSTTSTPSSSVSPSV